MDGLFGKEKNVRAKHQLIAGNAANGEQQLVVTMELNGVQYEGVLFANPTTSLSNSTNASTPTKTNPNSSHNSIDERETNRVARPLVSS